MSPRRNPRSFIARTCRPDRRGETSNTTVVIIIVAVVAGILLLACVPVSIALLLPAVQQARQAARRTQSMNNLKMMGLAVHTFHDANTHLPTGVFSADGAPLHSWQTQMLPFVEHAPLYDSINLEQPWDDPANSPMFRSVILTYLNPAQTGNQFAADGSAVSHYSMNSNLVIPNQPLSISDITDGTSNTAYGGEAAGNFKAWGDPANTRDPVAGINAGPDGFGGPFVGGASMVLMDGSVRFIANDVDPAVLKALSTPNGGEQMPPF
jgi:hypothetical protein